MSKKIFVVFILLLILTGCDDQAYLERAVGVYFDTHDEAAQSNELSTTYGYQDGETSQDKRLKMNINEKLELEKAMTNGKGSYSIGYIGKEGTLRWHSFYKLFEKVEVYIEDIPKPYVIRLENEVYYKKKQKVYYPRNAVYELHLSSHDISGMPTSQKVCTGTIGKSDYNCQMITENHEVIN